MLPTPENRGQVYQNLFFSLLGVYGRPHIERFAARVDVRRLLLTAVAYGLIVTAILAFGAQTWFGIWPIASAIAVAFGVCASVMIGRRLTRIGSGLAALGRRTLGIYVIHLPLLALLDLASRKWDLEPTAFAYALIEPVVVTAALIAVCIALERTVKALGAHFLFDLPRASLWRSDAQKAR
jgi:fucose 4-O-acetylase-like acetyltransferase